MLEHYENEYLVILAGFPKDSSLYQLQEYFRKALLSLGEQEKSVDELLFVYANEISQAVSENKITAKTAISILEDIAYYSKEELFS